MGIKEFLSLQHSTHCEISAFGTYFGLVAFISALIMYLIFQIPILNNLIILFGMATLAGGGAVFVYRYLNNKYPFH